MQTGSSPKGHEAPAPRNPDAPVGWGAAIVDDQGNETPITESMVARACDELARSWLFPRRTGASALAR